MSSGWHRHGTDGDIHRDNHGCRDTTPVLVLDLAGAREQIARAVYRAMAWSGCAGSDFDRLLAETRAEYLRAADAVLAALGAPEEGEDRG